jgi:hypothetical protein
MNTDVAGAALRISVALDRARDYTTGIVSVLESASQTCALADRLRGVRAAELADQRRVARAAELARALNDDLSIAAAEAATLARSFRIPGLDDTLDLALAGAYDLGRVLEQILDVLEVDLDILGGRPDQAGAGRLANDLVGARDIARALSVAFNREELIQGIYYASYFGAREYDRSEQVPAEHSWAQTRTARRLANHMLSGAARLLSPDQRADYVQAEAANLALCTSWQEWLSYLANQLDQLPLTAWVYRRERRRRSAEPLAPGRGTSWGDCDLEPGGAGSRSAQRRRRRLGSHPGQERQADRPADRSHPRLAGCSPR